MDDKRIHKKVSVDRVRLTAAAPDMMMEPTEIVEFRVRNTTGIKTEPTKIMTCHTQGITRMKMEPTKMVHAKIESFQDRA